MPKKVPEYCYMLWQGESLKVHPDTPVHVHHGFFRELESEDEKRQFRAWAKTNKGPLNPLYHPYVQDEMINMAIAAEKEEANHESNRL